MKVLPRVWIDPKPVSVPEALRSVVGGHPLLAETLLRRGIETGEKARAFLDPETYRPCSAFALPDVDRAVEHIQTAIRRQESIWVWGDFDVDGQTSTTVLVEALRQLGGKVNYHIPVRARESHGINQTELAKILDAGANLLLTCDTGITSHAEIAAARARGVDVIVTDHHDLPPELPAAEAVVNPKRLPEAHPLRDLPGVGVAYKLIEALAGSMGRHEVAEGELDLAALGIVADLATLREDTRYLLQLGLRRLRETKRPGLLAMFDLASLNPQHISEEHIGFLIGPRLNALGRLGDANPAVEFFTTSDPVRARILATEMEGLNAQRRLLVDQVYQAAQAQIEREPNLLEGPGLVLAHPTWPAGVIGIVASRLVDQYHRPTILIAAPAGETARGSARSVEGVHVTQAIAACKDLLAGFGGHPMAAGLGMDPEKIAEFRRAFNRAVADQVGDQPMKQELSIECYMNLADLNLDLVRDIERLAPFGPGNPSLVLATRNLTLTGLSTVGRNGEHLQLIVEDPAGKTQKVIWWQGAGQPIPEGKFDLAYVVRASDFRGQREVQVEWVEARVVETAAIEVGQERPGVEIVDFRGEPNQAALLKALLEKNNLQVWGEVDGRTAGQNRTELRPSPALAIWTLPPGDAELKEALDRVAPKIIYLFAQDPGIDQIDSFLKRLAGLLKFILNTEPAKMSLERLSAAMGHRQETVRKGLDWMEAKGYFSIAGLSGTEIEIFPGSRLDNADRLPSIEAQLRAMLVETAAYRKFFASASSASLLPMGKKRG